MSVVPAGVEVSQMDPHQAALMASDHCILVDCQDRPIGSAAKQECHLMTEIKEGKALHRAFSVFLFNEKNELLLQRRSGVKPTFPLRWTNTCCSHPLHGGPEADEVDNVGVKRAAIRKLLDELGIPQDTFAESDFVYLTRIHYCALSDGKWGEHEIDHLMFVRKPLSFKVEDTLNKEEVAEVKWVSPAGLRAEFEIAKENPSHLTPWFQMIAEKLLFGWWENGKLDEVLAAGGLDEATRKQTPQILTLPSKPDTQIPPNTPGLQEALKDQKQ